VYHFEKYHPKHHPLLPAWSWVQLTMTLLFISYFFGNIAGIGTPDMFIYGGFVFLTVYANTELMDRNANAVYFEGLKNLFGIVWIIQTGDWFGISEFIVWAKALALVYFAVSTLVVSWFCLQIRKEDTTKSPAF
jgi:hypothetical protein